MMISLNLTLFNFYTESMMGWWSTFFSLNLVFLYFIIKEEVQLYFFSVYFYVQELMGFLFIFSLSNFMVLMVLMFKSSLGLFFFLVWPMIKFLNGIIFFLFYFLFKNSLYPCPNKVCFFSFDSYLGFSLLLSAGVPMFFKDLKSLGFFNSAESATLILVTFSHSLMDSMMNLIMYFFIFFSSKSSMKNFLDLEKSFFFLGLPFNVIFFIKVTFFCLVFNQMLLFLLFVFSMWMSMMGSLHFLLMEPVMMGSLKKLWLNNIWIFFIFFYFIFNLF
uniref:NADH dehydrogenase subunit 2 n=1 Tax=Pratylenchus vulnus TaxID=45931 RepID=M1E1R8_PRAVU|nr:NADH dehydrogenase subunit 2 [Pratylenchus vulnus]